MTVNTPSSPKRYLLDRHIIRHLIVGLSLGQRQSLASPSAEALSLWQLAESQGIALCITDSLAYILKQQSAHAVTRFILAATTELGPTRYCRRWARRVCELADLPYEDAMTLAFGSFGIDQARSMLGVQIVVISNRSMLDKYNSHLYELRQRLDGMKARLPSPLNAASLPAVSLPDGLLGK
ncbi:MAG: hypothetical protein JW850_15215 [Thermoflexales bacterium]|nr:hypothetical protein [Thermoflexales bacterium]